MKKLLFGILLAFLSVGAPAWVVVSMIQSFDREAVVFKAPGEIVVNVDEPGRYYLWNEHRTIFEGRSYSVSKELPSGMTFALEKVETGESLAFDGNFSMSVSTGQKEMNSVGYFEIKTPGQYRLSIDGLDQPRVFSFGESVFGEIFSFLGRFAAAMLVAMFAFVAGVALIVLGILDLARQERRGPPEVRFPES